MAGGFAKSMTRPGSGAETGMIVEIDFVPIRDWFTDIYQRNGAEAKAFSEEAPDEMNELTGEENLNRINDAMRRLQSLSYHQWITDGKPRTSFHVRISPAKWVSSCGVKNHERACLAGISGYWSRVAPAMVLRWDRLFGSSFSGLHR